MRSHGSGGGRQPRRLAPLLRIPANPYRTNGQAHEFQRALRSRGLPYRTHGPALFARRAVGHVLAHVRLVGQDPVVLAVGHRTGQLHFAVGYG
ncbi:MAG: hypothetical protein ACRDJN_12535, partial [Chloroflexota bacterium]